jgi:hypothetical protein
MPASVSLHNFYDKAGQEKLYQKLDFHCPALIKQPLLPRGSAGLYQINR